MAKCNQLTHLPFKVLTRDNRLTFMFQLGMARLWNMP